MNRSKQTSIKDDKRVSNVCFVCDQPASPLNEYGSVTPKSSVFQKLHIQIIGEDLNSVDTLCGNCTVILGELDALQSRISLLANLINRQIERKYQTVWRGPDELPNIYLLNDIDMKAVKIFKLLANDYVCTKCNFRTRFQDTLAPHFQYHAICDKPTNLESKRDNGTNSFDDDLIEYNPEYQEDDDEIATADLKNIDLNDSAEISEQPTDHVLDKPLIEEQEELQFTCKWCPYKNSEYVAILKHNREVHLDTKSSVVIENEHKHPPQSELNYCRNCGNTPLPEGICNHEKVAAKGLTSRKCPKCKEIFYMNHLLHEHLRHTHFSCNFCGKTFAKFKKLQQHEYTHKDGPAYKCTECDKEFKTRNGLIYHMPKHTGNYSHYCKVCKRGFMCEKFLELHMAIHTKEHKYVCDVCGTKFIHNATYRLHRLWHDNPYPYTCSDCGEKFKHTSILAIHRRREHTGERPYKCDICSKTFLTSSSYKKHQLIHPTGTTHSCTACNVQFNVKQKFLQHLREVHGVQSNNTKRKCEYKMVLRPEYTTEQDNNEASDTEDQPAESFVVEEELDDSMIEEILNASKLDDNLFYNIIL